MTRRRYVRRRTWARTRHATRFFAWLAERVTALTGTGATTTFTVADAGADTLTSASHGLNSGDGPLSVSNSGGALPAGLAASTLYWAIRVDANTIKLASDLANARAGVAVDVTDAGTGTHSYFRAAETNEAIFERMRQGVASETIAAATDIDGL